MPTIERVSALEILDSRGRPTVQATCVLTGGVSGTISVPSGASTGTGEAVDVRDGDRRRYRGLGCRMAVGHVNGALNDALATRSLANQAMLDHVRIGGSRDTLLSARGPTSVGRVRPRLSSLCGDD